MLTCFRKKKSYLSISWPSEREKGLHLSLYGNTCFDRQAKVNVAAAL